MIRRIYQDDNGRKSVGKQSDAGTFIAAPAEYAEYVETELKLALLDRLVESKFHPVGE